MNLNGRHLHNLIARSKSAPIWRPAVGLRDRGAASPINGTPSRLLRFLMGAALAWAMTFGVSTARLQAQVEATAEISREYVIKSAYLLQFGRYVEWPSTAFADNHSPLVIGVLGTNPFSTMLEQIARTKRIEGRPVVVRQIPTMAQYSPCHILFVTMSAGPAETAAAIGQGKQSHVLLVGEEAGFAERGGIINFFVDENRVRFEVNPEAAQQEQLKISSELLSLAKIVGK